MNTPEPKPPARLTTKDDQPAAPIADMRLGDTPPQEILLFPDGTLLCQNEESVHIRLQRLVAAIRKEAPDKQFPVAVNVVLQSHLSNLWNFYRDAKKLELMAQRDGAEREATDLKSQLTALRVQADAMAGALERANEMHLGRCGSSEPLSAKDYRDHACKAHNIILAALSAYHATAKPTQSSQNES